MPVLVERDERSTLLPLGSIDSSFDGAKPYTHVVEMPSASTTRRNREARSRSGFLSSWISEGMEVEALGAFVPGEKRLVYVVGELHDVSVNRRQLDEIFRCPRMEVPCRTRGRRSADLSRMLAGCFADAPVDGRPRTAGKMVLFSRRRRRILFATEVN